MTLRSREQAAKRYWQMQDPIAFRLGVGQVKTIQKGGVYYSSHIQLIAFKLAENGCNSGLVCYTQC